MMADAKYSLNLFKSSQTELIYMKRMCKRSKILCRLVNVFDLKIHIAVEC
jgi:hypothetical protein